MTALYEWLAAASLWWWPRFADHLWQTTLFALVVSVAAFTLRGGPARVRHNFWLLASAKFIVPAVLFVFVAQWAGIDSLPIFRSAPAAEQGALLVTGITKPSAAIIIDYEVAETANLARDYREIYFALTAVWLAGCIGLVFVWVIRRQKFLYSLRLGRRLETGREWQAFERARQTLGLQAGVGLVISPLKIEPAAWRVWRPLVVMPESIARQLDDEELEAIMLHELVHIQRRDNLIGNLQLAVCALLWFHPLVWFITRRLFDEREQACDERVMEVSGAPEAYASSILKVVRFSFGWKIAGVTGATSGSNLRRRIENIMTMGDKKRGTGTATGLLAGALVGMALLVLVGAGVYSKAQSRDAMAGEAEVAAVEMAPPSDTKVTFSLANVLGWNTQKTKRDMPPPPPPAAPAQPSQPAQPPKTSQPVMPPPPPKPAASAQPAQAPEPSQVPNPAQAPQPSQAPAPPNVPQPAQASAPPGQPVQAPPLPPVPESSQGLQLSPPVPAVAGTGKGGATGFGRGVATGVSVAPARSKGGTVSNAGGSGVGTAAVVAPARSMGQGISIAGGRGIGSAASSAPGRAVGKGVSIAGGSGTATGVGGSVPMVAPARSATASPRAVPAPRPLPEKQEKSRPQE